MADATQAAEEQRLKNDPFKILEVPYTDDSGKIAAYGSKFNRMKNDPTLAGKRDDILAAIQTVTDDQKRNEFLKILVKHRIELPIKDILKADKNSNRQFVMNVVSSRLDDRHWNKAFLDSSLESEINRLVKSQPTPTPPPTSTPSPNKKPKSSTVSGSGRQFKLVRYHYD